MPCPCRCHAYGPSANTTCDTGAEQPGGNRSCSPCDAHRPQPRPDDTLTILVRLSYDLDFVEDNWPSLCESRRIGTPRPWRQALLDPDVRAAQLARDREERELRDPDAPGFTSAPEHVDVLDVMVAVWVALDELVHRISPDWRRSRAGGAKNRAQAEHGPSRFTEVDPMLEFVRLWIGAVNEVEPGIARGPAQQLHTLTSEISRVLGLVRAGQLLSGAVCPWCRGVTPKHPAGGATTLRVEEIAKAKHATDLRPAVEAVHAVVCWNPLCDPDQEDCGTRYKGRPAWPWHEWEWLAKRLIIAEPQITQSTPLTLAFEDGRPYTLAPVERSGRSGIASMDEPA
jgi:hypothetical protein